MEISSLSIWEKLSKLAKTQKRSLKGAAKATGVSEGAISGWKKSFPTVDNLAYLADYYGVTIDYLVNDEKTINDKLSEDEWNLVTNYRNLPIGNQQNIRDLINSMLSVTDGERGKRKAAGQ